MHPTKILVLLTGGTICSFENRQGHRYADASKVNIIETFLQSHTGFAFDSAMPLNILSENMTVEHWNTLLDAFRKVDFDTYDGIILLHGTDTLAYTAALLSVALSGIKIPVILVSAHSPLHRSGTNGHANFEAAARLIQNKIAPNVYAVYQNKDGKMLVHEGARLRQCGDYSDDFYSDTGQAYHEEYKGKPFENTHQILHQMAPLSPCVLQIHPYVGMHYKNFLLTGIKGVLHGTYHSQTVCAEQAVDFAKRCKEQNILVVASPCSEQAFAYETTGQFLSAGAKGVYGQTTELVYAKMLVGYALGLDNDAMLTFIN